jgi:hypothetical protein
VYLTFGSVPKNSWKKARKFLGSVGNRNCHMATSVQGFLSTLDTPNEDKSQPLKEEPQPAPYASPPIPEEPPKDNLENVKLFLGQLPNTMYEQGLCDLFSPFGEITEVKILLDKITNVHKGIFRYYFINLKVALF